MWKATFIWESDAATEIKKQDKTIQRRITAGFAKHSDSFKGNIGTCLTSQFYNVCVHPATTHRAEIWAFTVWVSENTRSQTWLNKSVDWSVPGQGTSAGYEITDGHWVSPPQRKIPRGRPARRWRDYWKGTIWQRIAQDRQMWKQHIEAFAHQEDSMAAQW